jgi:hypothetical protein
MIDLVTTVQLVDVIAGAAGDILRKSKQKGDGPAAVDAAFELAKEQQLESTRRAD